MVMKLAAIFVVCVISPAAWGCATCFGDVDSAQTQGMNMGIITLLGITGVVVGCMAVVTGAILLRMRRMSLEAVRTGEESSTPTEAESS
jgi:hypothetical protein